MEFELFKREMEDLNEEIMHSCCDTMNEVYPISDGPMDIAEYYNTPQLKIVWLMKEPYETGEREGGWSIPGLYSDNYPRFFTDLINGASGRTWQPVVYATYGILNDFALWDEIPFIRNDPAIVKVLSKVAWVNIQKLPSEIGTSTNIGHIHEAYNKHKTILKRQINLLDPDLVICGNTFSVIADDLGNPKPIFLNDNLECYSLGKRLYINVYHPAQRRITREKYVNDIVSCVKKVIAK